MASTFTHFIPSCKIYICCITGSNYQMEIIHLFYTSWLRFHLTVKEYVYSIQFVMCLNSAMWSESECFHTCHVWVMGVMRKFVYREIWNVYFPPVLPLSHTQWPVTLNKLSFIFDFTIGFTLCVCSSCAFELLFIILHNQLISDTELQFPYFQPLSGKWESEVYSILLLTWHVLLPRESLCSV
jgi:hypothetical protein